MEGLQRTKDLQEQGLCAALYPLAAREVGTPSYPEGCLRLWLLCCLQLASHVVASDAQVDRNGTTTH